MKGVKKQCFESPWIETSNGLHDWLSSCITEQTATMSVTLIRHPIIVHWHYQSLKYYFCHTLFNGKRYIYMYCNIFRYNWPLLRNEIDYKYITFYHLVLRNIWCSDSYKSDYLYSVMKWLTYKKFTCLSFFTE